MCSLGLYSEHSDLSFASVHNVQRTPVCCEQSFSRVNGATENKTFAVFAGLNGPQVTRKMAWGRAWKFLAGDDVSSSNILFDSVEHGNIGGEPHRGL